MLILVMLLLLSFPGLRAFPEVILTIYFLDVIHEHIVNGELGPNTFRIHG